MDTLPTDIIYTILSDYIPMPYICTSVYHICHLNNSIYLKHKRTVMICKFFQMYDICLMHYQNFKPYLKYFTDLEILIRHIPYVIQYLPEEKLNYELCKLAVSLNPSVIQHIKEKFITEELIALAIIKNYYVITYLDDKYITDAIVEKYLITNKDVTLHRVPEKYRTKELLTKLLYNNFTNLKYIDQNLITYDICLNAARNGCPLDLIPKHHRTKEIYTLVVYNNSNYILDIIPSDYITYELCYTAVCKNGYQLKSVPKELVDYKLCLTAVRSQPLISYIKKTYPNLVDFNLYLEAVLHDGISIVHIPTDMLCKEICYAAVSNNGSSIQYIPLQHHSYELHRIAVSNNYYAIRYVPSSYITEELALIALKHGFGIIKYIPESIRSRKLYIQANYTTPLDSKKIPNISFDDIYNYNPSKAPLLGKEYIKRFIQEYNL